MEFSSKEQITYHTWNQVDLGRNYLVSNAHFQSNSRSSIEKIHNDDLFMNLEVVGFLSTLSRHQQKKFATIIQQVRKSSHAIEHNTDDNWKHTNIPETYPALRRVYLDGKNALIPNIPYPKATKIDIGHSYMSIKDMIKHFLALNIKMDEMWINNPMYEEHTSNCNDASNTSGGLIIHDISNL
jgi:hypothetical protein